MHILGPDFDSDFRELFKRSRVVETNAKHPNVLEICEVKKDFSFVFLFMIETP